MSFKLTKVEIKRRDDYASELSELADKLSEAIDTFNQELVNARTPVEAAVEAYNTLLEEAKGFAFDIANQAENDISEKSEKWQEGERGEAANEWKDAWENIELDEIEIEFPEELDVPDFGHSAELEALATEMEG